MPSAAAARPPVPTPNTSTEPVCVKVPHGHSNIGRPGCLGERAEDVSDGVLPGLSGSDFGVVFGAGCLLGGRELDERILAPDAGDALWGGGEVEPQGAFDGDFAVAEFLVGEHFAERQRPGARLVCPGVLVGEGASLAVGEAAVNTDQVVDVSVGDLMALVVEALCIFSQKRRASMSWTLPRRCGSLRFVTIQM